MLNFPSTLPQIPLVRELGLAPRGISSAKAARVKETGFIKHHKYWIVEGVGMHRKGSHDGSRCGSIGAPITVWVSGTEERDLYINM